MEMMHEFEKHEIFLKATTAVCQHGWSTCQNIANWSFDRPTIRHTTCTFDRDDNFSIIITHSPSPSCTTLHSTSFYSHNNQPPSRLTSVQNQPTHSLKNIKMKKLKKVALCILLCSHHRLLFVSWSAILWLLLIITKYSSRGKLHFELFRLISWCYHAALVSMELQACYI